MNTGYACFLATGGTLSVGRQQSNVTAPIKYLSLPPIMRPEGTGQALAEVGEARHGVDSGQVLPMEPWLKDVRALMQRGFRTG